MVVSLTEILTMRPPPLVSIRDVIARATRK